MSYEEACREAREHLRYVSPVGSKEIYVWNPYCRCLVALNVPHASFANLEDCELKKDWEIVEDISGTTTSTQKEGV